MPVENEHFTLTKTGELTQLDARIKFHRVFAAKCDKLLVTEPHHRTDVQVRLLVERSRVFRV